MKWKSTREPVDAWHMTDDLHVQHGKADPFAAAIRATRMSMVITNPRRPDNPIVFANDSFLRLTGYGREEVIGKNCRFLQGPETSLEAVDAIRQALENQTDIAIDILNYRKDGTPFWNALYLSPVSNENGDLQFFFASQVDVTDRKRSEGRVRADKERFEKAVKERTRELEAALEAQTTLLHEVDHRVKNNLQMIASLIVMQMRGIKDEATRASLTSILERFEALSTVHRRLYQSQDVGSFDIAEFIRDLVSGVVAAGGRSGIETELDLSPAIISAQMATPVALMINELITNALKHGFRDKPDSSFSGKIKVKLAQHDGHIDIEVADDGVGLDGVAPNGSFGTKMVRSLARQLRADVGWHPASPGTRVSIRMPHAPATTNTTEIKPD